jgi:spore coat polysaccharide biosynthesis protein SpsF
VKYQTEQEEFWAGDFGDDYVDRNKGEDVLASNLHFFSKAFVHAQKPRSIIEFGANIGMNLRAIRLLFPDIECYGIEINKKAANELSRLIGDKRVFHGSIFEYDPVLRYDVALVKGVLIHIHPEHLMDVYTRLYHSSRKYILLCEYYSPSPVTISYRGHADKLYKRDFAGELMSRYRDLVLVDYGFCYRLDAIYPQDDITWFLLKKGETC